MPLLNLYSLRRIKYFTEDKTMLNLIRKNKLDIINGIWIPFKVINNNKKKR